MGFSLVVARPDTQRIHVCYLVHSLALLLSISSGKAVIQTHGCFVAMRSVRIGAVVGVLAIHFIGLLAAEVVSVRKLPAMWSQLPESPPRL